MVILISKCVLEVYILKKQKPNEFDNAALEKSEKIESEIANLINYANIFR